MNYIDLGNLSVSRMALGCMRIGDKPASRIDRLIHTAQDCGINLYDHADIYGKGESEARFGEFLRQNPGFREKILLQSKCGIHSGTYDFSRRHIISSVEGSLRRLCTDHLDILLLHRPDALAEQEEFASAVRELKQSGKVRCFGVSNMNPAQLELLEQWCGEPLVADQLQLSLMHAGMVTAGLNVNVGNSFGTDFDGSVLPYCQRTGRVLQAWSPLQYGMFQGCFVGDPQFPKLNAKLNELAELYRVTPAAIAMAWILRIPGKLQVVIGSSDPEHVRQAAAADGVNLTRRQWYELYRSCGYPLP